MKTTHVAFATVQLETSFEKLVKGKHHERQLYAFIERAIIDLKNNPSSGIHLPKQLWPRSYIREYALTNLWKYDLSNGW